MKIFKVVLFVAILHFNGNGQTHFVKGVYGNPSSLLKAGYRFDSLGINAVFVRSISLNPDLFSTAKDQGCKVFVEFPTLNGDDYLKIDPEAWPINEQGMKAKAADWFMGVCPTDTGLKKYRAKQLEKILDQYDVDGIFLDYFHWHAQFESDKPVLPETCFCNRCTSLFEKQLCKAIPGDDAAAKAVWILKYEEENWRSWRMNILNNWIDEMKAIVKTKRPKALLGVYHCGWYPSDHDSALGRILGIDILSFAERADVLAPMLFHGMLGRRPEWVGEYLAWLEKELRPLSKPPKLWPIVQAHDKPGIISPGEFRKVMTEGMRSPSSGVMMFEDGSLLKDPEKLKVMKALYRSRQ